MWPLETWDALMQLGVSIDDVLEAYVNVKTAESDVAVISIDPVRRLRSPYLMLHTIARHEDVVDFGFDVFMGSPPASKGVPFTPKQPFNPYDPACSSWVASMVQLAAGWEFKVQCTHTPPHSHRPQPP